MALNYEKVFGYKKGDGPKTAVPFNETNPSNPEIIRAEGDKMSEIKYKVICDVLVEKGVRHIKGENLKIDVDPGRIAAFIRAGYIEKIAEVAPVPEKKEKAIEAPENKMIDKAPESKGASGKGANLLKKKAKK